MVIFKTSHAGIAQTHLENHDATNSPHDLLAVTTNNYKPVCMNYKPVCMDYKTCLYELQTGPLHTTNECI